MQLTNPIPFAQNVSRATLLVILLPLSYIVFFSSMVAGARFYPGGYDWKTIVISRLISPRHNPEGYWLAAGGLALTVFLVWPIAGYVEQGLRAIAPRLAKYAGAAFSLSFFTLLMSLLAQHIQPLLGVKWLHELTARTAAFIFAFGLACCIKIVIQDWRRSMNGEKRSLGRRLALSWSLLTLMPIVCPAVIGVLILFGKYAGLAWAIDARESFRHTPLWHLAFWEWVGTCNIFAFLTTAVLFLPREVATQTRGAVTDVPSLEA